LVKILEGPKEGVMDLEWHPTRPIVVSCSTTGMAYIWNAHYTENWSAFAPGFTELEENLEYIEKEDEFDIVDEETEANKKKKKQEEEDVIVDIITVEKTSGDLSSDEEDELFFLPTCPMADKYLTPLSFTASSPAKSTLKPKKRKKKRSRKKKSKKTRIQSEDV